MMNDLKEAVPVNEEFSTLNLFTPGVAVSEKLIAEFLGATDANEISNTLSSLLDSYLVHTEEDRLEQANAAGLVIKLIQLFYKLQNNIQKT